eukprot:scaffold3036_cov414-Prasinococcus_capsulatus_cf.AAC.3
MGLRASARVAEPPLGWGPLERGGAHVTVQPGAACRARRWGRSGARSQRKGPPTRGAHPRPILHFALPSARPSPSSSARRPPGAPAAGLESAPGRAGPLGATPRATRPLTT